MPAEGHLRVPAYGIDYNPGMRSRSLLATLPFLALMAACTIAPEVKKPNWLQATGGEHYERLFWDSVRAKNWGDVEAHLAGTVVTQTPDAVRNKQQVMEHIRQIDLADYSLGDIKVEPNGADVVVTYTITLKGTIGGHPLPDAPERMMTVWQETKKGVVMIAHSTMPSPH